MTIPLHAGLRDALKTYFSDEQIERLDKTPDGKQAGGAGVMLGLDRDGMLAPTSLPPASEWVTKRLSELGREAGLWHLVANIKARFLADTTTLIERAKTGDLYDEDYYTRRGGGSPYVNYPREDNGADATERFSHLAREIKDRFSPTHALDCGCATGILVKALQDIGVDARGFDVSDYATSHAVTRNIHKARGESLPFANETFDLAISQDFMEHIDPPAIQAVLSEQARVLKPGGHACHFIPFYETDTPYQLDAHLCNASRAWWIGELRKASAFEIVQTAPEENQWDYSNGILSRYFILWKKQ